MIGAPRCPLCGAAFSACGPHAPATPVDVPSHAIAKEDPMALLEYDVVFNGHPTTALLTEAQAARLGATPVTSPKGGGAEEAPPVKGKARKPANKGA